MVYLAAQYLLYQKEEFVKNIFFDLTDTSVMPEDGSSFSSLYLTSISEVFVHKLNFLNLIFILITFVLGSNRQRIDM